VGAVSRAIRTGGSDVTVLALRQLSDAALALADEIQTDET
jgi:hypothetical protein